MTSGDRPVATRRPRLVFVFSESIISGATVVRQLLDQPAFRKSLEESDRCIGAVASWSVLDVLTGDGRPASDPRGIGQAHAALQVALAALWRSWGVLPDNVIADGPGAAAAACERGTVYVTAWHIGQYTETATTAVPAWPAPRPHDCRETGWHHRDASLAVCAVPSLAPLSILVDYLG